MEHLVRGVSRDKKAGFNSLKHLHQTGRGKNGNQQGHPSHVSSLEFTTRMLASSPFCVAHRKLTRKKDCRAMRGCLL